MMTIRLPRHEIAIAAIYADSLARHTFQHSAYFRRNGHLIDDEYAVDAGASAHGNSIFRRELRYCTSPSVFSFRRWPMIDFYNAGQPGRCQLLYFAVLKSPMMPTE